MKDLLGLADNTTTKPLNQNKMENENTIQGLTKREYFAGLAMQGIMAQFTQMRAEGKSTLDYMSMDRDIAEECVLIADALLAELNKSE